MKGLTSSSGIPKYSNDIITSSKNEELLLGVNLLKNITTHCCFYLKQTIVKTVGQIIDYRWQEPLVLTNRSSLYQKFLLIIIWREIQITTILHVNVNEQPIRLIMADEIKNLIKPIVLSGEQYENRYRVFVQISNSSKFKLLGWRNKKAFIPMLLNSHALNL